MSEVAITPREAQVKRFIEASSLFDRDMAAIDDITKSVKSPGDYYARMKEARTNGSLPFLTAQQKAVAGAAIDAFVTGLRAGSWPDMSTMSEAELESYREHAIAWLEQG